jgi:glycosyltransferase involved in cell wall biosynthesis
MKIFHIIDSGGLYGAEIVLLNLVEEQKQIGLEPTIASIGEKGTAEKPFETEAIKRGVDVVKFRMHPGPNFLGMLQVLRYARAERFDILHSHGYKGNVAFGFIPRRMRKLPLISTLHGYTSTAGLSKNRIYEWLDLKSMKHIDAVVLVNRGMLSSPGISRTKNIDYYVVNNGIPISDIKFNNSINRQPDKEIVDFCSHGFIIGSIGRLSPEKGHSHILSALEILVKKGIDGKVVLIGEGRERGSIERKAIESGLRERVLMPGYRSDARDYLTYFHAFVLPSLTEGLPVTLLEAMQAGIPIIATNVGGIPDVLDNGSCGLLVEPCKADLIAEALSTIIHNGSDVRQMADRAYQRVKNSYSARAMAEEYSNIYEKISKRYH